MLEFRPNFIVVELKFGVHAVETVAKALDLLLFFNKLIEKVERDLLDKVDRAVFFTVVSVI
jgi:hypothetical protein